MSTTQRLTRLWDAIYSRGFLLEVSRVLLLFACIDVVVGIVWFLSAGPRVDQTVDGIAAAASGCVYALLAWALRRGSRAALWVTASLFAFDLVVLALIAPGKTFVMTVFWRLMLFALLGRDLKRRLAPATT